MGFFITDIPVVTIKSKQYTAHYGESVTLECDIDAIPPATRCFWFKTVNGITKEIFNGFAGTLGITLKTPSLTIVFATPSDTGRYKCIAQNVAGVGQSQSTKLEILAGKLKWNYEKTILFVSCCGPITTCTNSVFVLFNIVLWAISEIPEVFTFMFRCLPFMYFCLIEASPNLLVFKLLNA